ncbi:MAG: 3-dehydroquinate dehydratase [Muribaculaceae bacterium]|nr:3-dehydroquinate dehydratase [Muribaculaceae bacterium]
MEQYILILNGPNLNLLGFREPDIYGHYTLEDIMENLSFEFPDIRLESIQSNSEGDIIDAIHDTRADNDCIGIVLNAGAYTHTSLAIADAIAAVPTPVVEVHLTNIASREPIRRTSLIAQHCIGSISGFGTLSYSLAIRALLSR